MVGTRLWKVNNVTVGELLIILIVAVIIEAFLLIFIPFIYFKPIARKINRIVRKGKDALLLIYDDGRVFIKEVEQISKHGILRGKKSEYFIITTPKEVEKTNPASDPISQAARELVNKRAIIENTGSCLFIGYAGKITATTPFVLAAYDVANRPEVITVNAPEGKERLTIFSLHGLKKLMEEISGVTASGLMALIHDVEQRVLAEKKERFGSMKWFIILLIGIFVIAVVLRILGIGGG